VFNAGQEAGERFEYRPGIVPGDTSRAVSAKCHREC